MKAEEREKLKDQVMDMVLTGYSQREIAKKLGVSKRSVVSYVKDRRAEAIEEMRTSAEQEMAEMEIGKRKRVQRLWTIALDKTEKAGDRNKAIQLLQTEESMTIKRKQLIGLLPPEAPAVAVAIQNTNVVEGATTISDMIRQKYPELIERFSKIKAIEVKPKKEGR